MQQLSITTLRLSLFLLISHLSVALITFFIMTVLRESLILMGFLTILSGMLVGWFVWQRLRNHLIQMEIALERLGKGETVDTIPVKSTDTLYALVAGINTLSQQQREMGHMRGQLYEQISASAAQEERNRLARDLHDSIKQQIFTISVSAAAAQAQLDQNQDAVKITLRDIKQSAQEAMVEMRALLQQLAPAPLEKSGLVDALREQVEALSYRTGAQIRTQFGQLPDDQAFPIGAQEAVFRMAQEALSNIARHARANEITLGLQVINDDHLQLMIQDNGQGFDLETVKLGMGLDNIRSRASRLNADVSINSQIGKGTTIMINIPLVEQKSINPQIAENEARFSAFSQRWGAFVGGIAALTLGGALVASRLIYRPETIAEDAILAGLLIFMALIAIGGAVGAIWGYFNSQYHKAQLLLSAGKDSRYRYTIQRYELLGVAAICVVGFWFIPLLLIDETVPTVYVPLSALVFLFPLMWTYYRSYRTYDQELALMSVEEQRTEIKKQLDTTQAGWLSIGFLMLTLLLTGTFNNGIHILPTSADQWITSTMIFIGGLLVINQFLNVWYYRQKDQALNEATGA